MATTVSVHRCRFVDHIPSAITAIALPPLPLPPVKDKGQVTDSYATYFGTLAVGRANGNIELHEWSGGENQSQAPQAWVLQKVLPGPVPSKVDILVFTLQFESANHSTAIPKSSHLRLFSAGGGSEILEWNLKDGTILRSISSQAGSVWSMAANPSSTLLALGCEDGSVRILSLADDTLTHYRRFDRVKSRLLSIAWGPPIPRRSVRSVTHTKSGESSDDEEEAEWVDTWIVVGCSDSSLRKFDFTSGRVVDRMGTDKSRGESTLVWTIGVLGDGTIVSGDSLGTVKFWDSTTCTQLQSFQAHNADVLCLTLGPEGRSVYTSGVDQKVCQFSNVQVLTAMGGPLSAATSGRWIHAGSRRWHSHDVRALAVWPPYISLAASNLPVPPVSQVAPVLISGGLDMSLVICPCFLPSVSNSSAVINPIASSPISTFEDAYHRRVPYSTGMSPAVQVAREAKLLLCRRDTGISLWKINKTASPGEIGLTDLENIEKQVGEGWEKVADMELRLQTNLVASAISSDGHWVATSDLHQTKLFRLLHTEDEVRPKKVMLSEEASHAAAGATSLHFTADSSKLILGSSMGKPTVVVIDLAGEYGGSPRVLRTFEHHRMQNFAPGRRPGRVNRALSPEANGGVIDAIDETSNAEVAGSHSRFQLNSPFAAAVTCIATSLDGQWLASADTQHRVHVFNLDSVQHHCALPSFPHAIAALTFDPTEPSTLVIGFANNTLQVFDVEARQFPSLYRGVPGRLAHLHDPLLGVTFDPTPTTSTRRVLLWGSGWMCKVDLTAPVILGSASKKRRRESRHQSVVTARVGEANLLTRAPDEESSSTIITRYRPMLLVDFLAASELVVVERPLVDLLSTLPPAYFKVTYGS